MPLVPNNELTRRFAPEEEELARKRDELERLQSALVDRELKLADLRAELSAFEGLYLRRVGVLYSELDEWNARLAELIAEEEGTEAAQTAATQARAQATESDAAAHGEAAQAEEVTRSPELKSLFREVAKRIHPDTAVNEADRQKRTQLMAEANAAYEKGDAEALRRILAEYEASPESVQGTGVGADLVRIIRQIKQVEERLAQIELEIVALSDSDIAKLKAKAEAADAEGRDLLNEMAVNLRGRVNVARSSFEARLAARAKA